MNTKNVRSWQELLDNSELHVIIDIDAVAKAQFDKWCKRNGLDKESSNGQSD